MTDERTRPTRLLRRDPGRGRVPKPPGPPPPPGPPLGTRLVKPGDFTLMATDFTNGLQVIDGEVRIAIGNSGKVVFVGSQAATGGAAPPQAVFVSNGGALEVLATGVSGYGNVRAIRLAGTGEILFVADRPGRRGLYRGVPGSAAIATLYEGAFDWGFDPEGLPTPQQRIAIAPNDTLAFSSLVSGKGGVYRSTVQGPPTLLRKGSGVFYNNQALDVNSAGAVAVQMEYTDPNGGLQRGILLFDSVGDTLASIDTVIERQGVGTQPELAINDSGKVAFALNWPITIQYYTPILPASGEPATPTTKQSVPAGVHVGTPSPFGTPFTFTTIATPADGYSHFGNVSFSDAGRVVFEARFGGESGVFMGANAATDTIALTGEEVVIGGAAQFFSIVRLGDINSANQLAIQTSDFRSTDQKIWRVQLPPV